VRRQTTRQTLTGKSGGPCSAVMGVGMHAFYMIGLLFGVMTRGPRDVISTLALITSHPPFAADKSHAPLCARLILMPSGNHSNPAAVAPRFEKSYCQASIRPVYIRVPVVVYKKNFCASLPDLTGALLSYPARGLRRICLPVIPCFHV